MYQEVCGTIARRAGVEAAKSVKNVLDKIIDPMLISNCDMRFCESAYPLCSQFGIYAIDALYLKTGALLSRSIFVSLDREDLVNKLKPSLRHVETYHVSEFQY